MTFDEQLRRAFDALGDRLRDEMARQAQAAIDELASAAEADRTRAITDAKREAEQSAVERMAAAVAEAESRGREEGQELGRRDGREEGRQLGREEGLQVGREQGRAQGREEGWQDGRDEARREAETATRDAVEAAVAAARAERRVDAAASERLVHAVRAVDRARSLTDILETLGSAAAREAGRAAVLLVRHGRFLGWRFVGFGATLDASRSLDLASADAGVVREALDAGAPAIGRAPSFATVPDGATALAIPIAISGQVVAVLYADTAAPAGSSSEPATPNAEPRTSNSEPGTPNPERAIEILARHAARCLESLTAFKAARALLGGANGSVVGNTLPPSETGFHGAAGGNLSPNAADDGDGDDDAAARRYARLLVSEIKLYHEDAVEAGRREGDLGTRLGGEIARARVLYDERVPSHVRQRTDYFRDELVRTLANGDPGLLEMHR